MKLTKLQLDHIRARLRKAAEAKKAAADSALGLKPSAPTWAEKLAEIRAGRAVLKPGEVSGYTDIEDAFTFPRLERTAKAAKAATETRDRKFNALCAKIETEVESIMDAVVLGGNADDALRLVEAFVSA